MKKNQKNVDANGNYLKGSKTPKGRGNRSHSASLLQREAQKKSLGGLFTVRSRAMKEFFFQTKEGLVTMMGFDRQDAVKNLHDLSICSQAPKRESFFICSNL